MYHSPGIGSLSQIKLDFYYFMYYVVCILGVQDRKIKMVFNTGGTWRQVTFEKLMMKIYDIF